MDRTNRSVAVYAAALLLLAPFLATEASAQFGVKRNNDPFGGKPAPIVPVNLPKVLLSATKGIDLTDPQRLQITLIQRTLDSVSRPLITRLDSIRPSQRPAGGLNDLSHEQREQVIKHRASLVAVIDEMTPHFTRAREQVMAILTKDQQKRAAKLEKDTRKRAENVAKREMEETINPYGVRRRGEIRDATGRAPLD